MQNHSNENFTSAWTFPNFKNSLKMKVIIALALVATLALALALPQLERGSPLAPSGVSSSIFQAWLITNDNFPVPFQMFEMTENLAAPPVDLSVPAVFLPLAIPINEEPQEPRLTPRPRIVKNNGTSVA